MVAIQQCSHALTTHGYQMSSNGNRMFLVVNGMCGQLMTEKIQSPMGCVDSQQLKKFNYHFSSLKVTKNVQFPTTDYIVDDQKSSIAN